jgi:hypothetical protein
VQAEQQQQQQQQLQMPWAKVTAMNSLLALLAARLQQIAVEVAAVPAVLQLKRLQM